MMGYISPIATDVYGNPLQTGSQNSLDKDDFLNLLITQLTHQDPMNPLEDQEFIAQLAQFSSLEQMNNMNDSLQESLDVDYMQMQTINNTMATSLIGREVSASYSGVYLDDLNTPTISFVTDKYADSVEINILDSEGNKIRTYKSEDVSPGTNSFDWDGRDGNGNRVVPGYYQIELSAVDTEGESFTPSTLMTGEVTAITYQEGSAFLEVNGVEIPLSDIREIAAINGEIAEE